MILFEFWNWSKIQEVLTQEVQIFWTKTIIWFPRVIISIGLFFLFKWLSKKAYQIVSYYLKEKTEVGIALRQIIALISKISVFTIGIIIILGVLKLDKIVLSVLAGFGILGLGLSFAFQDLATNIISGVIIALQRPFEIGEEITVNEVSGKVNKIDLRTTELITPQGQIITVPNRKMIESNLINFSRLKVRRIDLEVGVSYAENLLKVEQVLLNAIKKLPFVKKEPPPAIIFNKFADSSINLYVIVWVDYENIGKYYEQISELIKLIHEEFNKHNITIPFPIRTLDFGIKGGVTLKEMLK